MNIAQAVLKHRRRIAETRFGDHDLRKYYIYGYYMRFKT